MYSRIALRLRRALALVVLALAAPCGAALAAAPAPAPSITSISPAVGSAAGGQTVTISGSNFVGPGGACNSGYRIWFGTDLVHGYGIDPSSYRVLSDNRITAVVPPNFGGQVDVHVHNACGSSPTQPADHFTYTYPTSQCLAGTCTLSIGSSPVGTLGHVGLGFLNGFNTDAAVPITPTDVALVKALHPRQWRFGQAGKNDEPGGGLFGLARSAGAQISLDLTSDWQDWAYDADRPYFKAPWGDLATYSWFISNDVKQRMAAGFVPDYFDVWNEPTGAGTINQWLSVYGAAYRAIKAADPAAQVVGPSIGYFLATSSHQGDQPGYDLTLSDFLNWEVQSGVRMAAIAWHEDGTTVEALPNSWTPDMPGRAVPAGFRDYWAPSAIGAHVLQAKQLIATYPALAATKVFVNEYGPTYSINIPGWMVGDFASLETAGADEGMMTCASGAACGHLFDGLLGWDGVPQMPYWVTQAYSQMSGERLAVSTSGTNLYALATRVDATRTVQALIGRADDCFGGDQCPQFHASSRGPAGLTVSVSVPWASAVDVTIEALRNTASQAIGYNDVAAAPATTVLSHVAVRAGAVSVPVGAIGDGDALYMTITPSAAASAPAPPSIPKTRVMATGPTAHSAIARTHSIGRAVRLTYRRRSTRRTRRRAA